MRKASRRLKHLIREEEKTAAKIAELQEYLSEIREARKKEEDAEILKSIRSLKLGARDLFDLLTGIRDGNVSMEVRRQLLEDAGEEDIPGTEDSPPEDEENAPAGDTEESAALKENKGKNKEEKEAPPQAAGGSVEEGNASEAGT